MKVVDEADLPVAEREEPFRPTVVDDRVDRLGRLDNAAARRLYSSLAVVAVAVGLADPVATAGVDGLRKKLESPFEKHLQFAGQVYL